MDALASLLKDFEVPKWEDARAYRAPTSSGVYEIGARPRRSARHNAAPVPVHTMYIGMASCKGDSNYKGIQSRLQSHLSGTDGQKVGEQCAAWTGELFVRWCTDKKLQLQVLHDSSYQTAKPLAELMESLLMEAYALRHDGALPPWNRRDDKRSLVRRAMKAIQLLVAVVNERTARADPGAEIVEQPKVQPLSESSIAVQVMPLCMAASTRGRRCCAAAVWQGFCRLHARRVTETVFTEGRCSAVCAGSGRRCIRDVVTGADVCHVHAERETRDSGL